jgi:pimeloyl-ACP methyl ester carboxylesterase
MNVPSPWPPRVEPPPDSAGGACERQALHTGGICGQTGCPPWTDRRDRRITFMNDNSVKFLQIDEGGERRALAVRQQDGTLPGLFFLSGYKSDMKGTKAEALAHWADQHGRACLRFDYSGHGESEGRFTDGTIGRWLADSLAVFDACCRGPQIVIGSSMGGWLALLLVRALRRRPPLNPPSQARGESAGPSVAGLVLIAPAVDFTEELMWKRFTPAIKRELEEKGVWERPSAYSAEPYLVTRQLIEEGRRHLLLGGMIETGCPVRILQGVEDADVPWRHAIELTSRLACDDVVLTLVKDGDHRLSRPEDIERLIAAIAEFSL